MKTGLCVVLSGLIFTSVTLAADEKVALDAVPAAVTRAVKTKFPGATLKKAEKEVENGKTTYEVEIKVDDKVLTISASDDGTILEIERAIAAADLPAAVTAAVKAKYPAGTIKKAEEVTKNDKVTFELIIMRKGGQPRELTLDKNGKVLDDEGAEDDD